MEIKEASYQTKLEEMAKQIDAIKADSTKKIPPQPSARKSLGTFKKEAFEILPGTVNTNRGSAAPNFSVIRMKTHYPHQTNMFTLGNVHQHPNTHHQ